MTKLFLIGALMLAACGSNSEDGVFGVVSPATGEVTLDHHGDAPRVSGVRFRNDGASDITVDAFRYTIVGSAASEPRDGIAVAAGETIGVSLCVVGPAPAQEMLDSLSFTVEGKTERLTVLEDKITETGPGRGLP